LGQQREGRRMSASNIRAGKAFVELSIKDKLTQGLRSASAKLQAFGTSVRTIGTAMAGIGAGGLAGILGAAKVFADAGSEIHDMSQRTGLAADNLSELKFAAEQTGASFEDVEKAIRFMQKQGIDASKFDEIAAAIASIEDPTKRAALAMKVWGRNGTALLGMAGDLPGLRGQARSLGASISSEQAKQADELGDAFSALKAAIKGITMQIGAAVAPALTKIIEVFTMAAAAVGRFIKAHPGLVMALAVAAGAFVVIGTIVASVGIALAVVGAALAAIGPIIAAATAAFAFLASPIGITIALFAALAATTTALIVVLRTAISKILHAMMVGAKAVLNSPLIPQPIKDFANGLAAVISAMRGLVPKFPKIGIPDIGKGDLLGEVKSAGGTSAGTASGRAAGLLGIGPGGGLLQETKKGNKLLEEVRDAVKGAKKAIEDLEGQKFE
jgi:hypothetical protein